MNIEARIKHLNAIKAQCDKELAELKAKLQPEPELVETTSHEILEEIETAAVADAEVKIKPRKRKDNGS